MGIILHKSTNVDIEYHELQPIVNCECDICHIKFTRKRVLIKRSLSKNKNPKLYCSPSCAKQASFGKPAEILKFLCQYCGKPHERIKSQTKKNVRNLYFCSQKCANSFFGKEKKTKKEKEFQFLVWFIAKFFNLSTLDRESKIYNCLNCSKKVVKKQSVIKKSKHNRFFCSKSCRMIWYNKNIKISSLKNKSKAETILYDLIKNDFSSLDIKQNDRKFLDSGLEIDILIPEIKLAIELNGPVHYFPIFGVDKLKNVENKDLMKQQEAISKGFNLIIVDISHLKGEKPTRKFLETYYNSHIKPIIDRLK